MENNARVKNASNAFQFCSKASGNQSVFVLHIKRNNIVFMRCPRTAMSAKIKGIIHGNFILFQGKVAVLVQIFVKHPVFFQILKRCQLHPQRFFAHLNGFVLFLYFLWLLLLVFLFGAFCTTFVLQLFTRKLMENDERMEEFYILKFGPIQKHCHCNLDIYISLGNKIELCNAHALNWETLFTNQTNRLSYLILNSGRRLFGKNVNCNILNFVRPFEV